MGLFSSSGTLDIHLDQPSISTGEGLKGSISVSVSEALAGCSLSVTLIGHSRRQLAGFARDSSRADWKRFFKEEHTLFEDTEVEATPKGHPFDILIAEDIGFVELNLPAGKLAGVAEQLLESIAAGIEYRWRLYARLVVPGMFNDLKEDIEVQITVPEDRVR